MVVGGSREKENRYISVAYMCIKILLRINVKLLTVLVVEDAFWQ
jgi:hypothetical protein